MTQDLDTPSRLLQVALQLFAEAGYENVGTQRIVETAAVKKPTLYYHFGSKQGLLKAVLQQHFDPFLAELQATTQYQGDLTHTLEQSVRLYFQQTRQAPQALRLGMALMYASEQSEGFACMRPYWQAQLACFESLFQAAEGQHGNLRGRSAFLSLAFLGAIHTQISAVFFQGMAPEALNAHHAFLTCKHFMHGIYAG